MKRRLLLVGADKADRTLVVEQLKTRFRAIDVVVAETLNLAHRALVDHECHIIITSLSLPDAESPASVIHSLAASATSIPIIVLTRLAHNDDSLLDVLTIGVRHILYAEDLKSDQAKLVTTIIETLRETTIRDAHAANFSVRMQALSQKVWDVDKRMESTEESLGTLTTSINNLAGIIEKRGGLEDRVVKLENTHSTAIKFGISFAGICGTALAALAVHLFDTMGKK